MNCCDDWEPQAKKLNAPILLAQARNPHLTATSEFQFKPWVFCPWCGRNRAETERVSARISKAHDRLTANEPSTHGNQ